MGSPTPAPTYIPIVYLPHWFVLTIYHCLLLVGGGWFCLGPCPFPALPSPAAVPAHHPACMYAHTHIPAPPCIVLPVCAPTIYYYYSVFYYLPTILLYLGSCVFLLMTGKVGRKEEPFAGHMLRLTSCWFVGGWSLYLSFWLGHMHCVYTLAFSVFPSPDRVIEQWVVDVQGMGHVCVPSFFLLFSL